MLWVGLRSGVELMISVVPAAQTLAGDPCTENSWQRNKLFWCSHNTHLCLPDLTVSVRQPRWNMAMINGAYRFVFSLKYNEFRFQLIMALSLWHSFKQPTVRSLAPSHARSHFSGHFSVRARRNSSRGRSCYLTAQRSKLWIQISVCVLVRVLINSFFQASRFSIYVHSRWRQGAASSEGFKGI